MNIFQSFLPSFELQRENKRHFGFVPNEAFWRTGRLIPSFTAGASAQGKTNKVSHTRAIGVLDAIIRRKCPLSISQEYNISP